MEQRLTNWSGNVTYSTANIHYPKTLGEIQQLVRQWPKLKVLGSKHCFNTIADCDENLVSLQAMNKVLVLDTVNQLVKVEAGITYGELCPYLHQNGFALHNLASLPHISVAGSIATATHGSGVGNGNLATQVVALEWVNAHGEISWVTAEADGDNFWAAVVGLGAVGIVTEITLRLQPAFSIRQFVFENLPFSQLYAHFKEIVSAAYSVSLFTNWQNEVVNSVWIKATLQQAVNFEKVEGWFGAGAATQPVHPLPDADAENCTKQLGIPGPWFERLPHFKWGFTPSRGTELQSEYFVAKQYGVAAIQAIAKLAPKLAPHLFISEIRTIAADGLWLSPCYQQDSVAIHFTWQQHIPKVMQLLLVVENALEPFKPRPHWGKLFAMAPATLQTRYPKMTAFKNFVLLYDPGGKFRNEFLETTMFGK